MMLSSSPDDHSSQVEPVPLGVQAPHNTRSQMDRRGFLKTMVTAVAGAIARPLLKLPYVDGMLDFVSFDKDGFTVKWVTGMYTVSGLGFQPDRILFFTPGEE